MSVLDQEIDAIPDLIRARFGDVSDIMRVAEAVRAAGPRFALTIARGSSDCVCEGLARALGTQLGLPTASLPPSLVTVDRAPLRFEGTLALVVSQAGRSPDLLEATRAARAGGALVVGILNVPDAPLAEVCDHVLAAGAAPETSIAATKSVVLSWLVGLHLIAAINHAPPPDMATAAAAIERAAAVEWNAAVSALDTTAVVVIGRGAGYAAAREIALKIKELVGIPAEAISAAEVMHGPRAMIGPTTGVLAVATDGATLDGPLHALAATTLRIVIAGPHAQSFDRVGLALPIGADLAADVAPVATTAALYRLAVALARRRGRDPDRPPHLSKVTLTR